ncbi:MAG TPA: hypothetical protein VG939_22335 [Caulobacteraceae bacterium]|nr:hypothetical protein [Caulobacteraceae bacterium]
MDLTRQERRGRRRGRWAVWLLVLGVVGGGAGVAGYRALRTEADAPPDTGPVETSICEKLLVEASEAEPAKFYICASRRKTIFRQDGGLREPMPLLANAVYELPLDKRVTVENLPSADMRYGWDGHYCSALLPAFTQKPFRLETSPVDPDSC